MANRSKYNKAIVDPILEELSVGKTIREVLSVPGRPVWSTFRSWLNKYPDLREKYNQAKPDGCEYILCNAEE
jgi:hypothetical protein